MEKVVKKKRDSDRSTIRLDSRVDLPRVCERDTFERSRNAAARASQFPIDADELEMQRYGGL